jgi:hypothetical protein
MLCKITNYSRGGSYYPGLHYSSSYSGASPDPKGKSGYASRQGATPSSRQNSATTRDSPRRAPDHPITYAGSGVLGNGVFGFTFDETAF